MSLVVALNLCSVYLSCDYLYSSVKCVSYNNKHSKRYSGVTIWCQEWEDVAAAEPTRYVRVSLCPPPQYAAACDNLPGSMDLNLCEADQYTLGAVGS